MTNLKTKLAVGLTTVAFLSAFATPTFAATNVEVKNNGADSTNKVKVKNKKTTTVGQSNVASVTNVTGISQNTGGNSASKNTGGNVKVKSGDATAMVTNTTTTGHNMADLNLCGCPDGDTDVKISGNGSDSYNKVTIKNISSMTVGQSNTSIVVNGTEIDQNTGDNKAYKNTGGDVKVKSGDANATVENDVETQGNELTLN